MYTCNICLKAFSRPDNMLRHKKSVHIQNEESDLSDGTSDYSDSDIEGASMYDEQEDSDTEMHYENDSNDPWDGVIQKAFEKCNEQFQEEVLNLLRKENISELEARTRVYEDMRSKYRKAMITVFSNRMVWFDAVRKHPIYKAIKRTATNLTDFDDYSQNEAWKSAISQRKYLFDNVSDEYNPPELDDQSEEENQDEEEEEGPSMKKIKLK